MVSIPACHAGNPGSIPGLGAFFLFLFFDIFFSLSFFLLSLLRLSSISPAKLMLTIVIEEKKNGGKRKRKKKKKWMLSPSGRVVVSISG